MSRTLEEKIAAVMALCYAMDTGDDEVRAVREVCVEFDCTPAELDAWQDEEVAALDAGRAWKQSA